MTLFYKKISESEALYSIEDNEIIISGGGQSSYNLPKIFFRYTSERNILIECPGMSYTRKEIDGNAYVLNEDYRFRLGPSILSLIGEGFENEDNKFIASVNGTNGKFQVYRKVYDNLGWRYNWFVELYDKNLSGNELILDIDEKNKIFTIDILFHQIKKNTYLEFINNL